VPKRDMPLQTAPGLNDAVGKSETECVCYGRAAVALGRADNRMALALLCLHGNGRDASNQREAQRTPAQSARIIARDTTTRAVE
jgi:hypothetical protein